MKTWWGVAFGVVGGLLGAGILYLASSPPRGQAITLSPPPSPAPILVHISGAVAHPGVYALPSDSRVLDGLEAAGGLLAQADAQILNLAAPLEDGERVFVPAVAPTQPPPQLNSAFPAGQTGAGQPPTPASNLASNLININTASQEELERLPGIGPVTAQKIITYRQQNGSFTAIEAIQDVPGIGPKTFERIKGFISVGY